MAARDRQILIADDDPVARRCLEAMLPRWGWKSVSAVDGVQALELLEGSAEPYLAIVDWMMPRMDGLQLCREVRARHHLPYSYIILVTARERKEDVVAALDAGADDYLVKPYDANELRARLGTGRRFLELQEELIAAREALRYQATHDALTGLYNRPAVLEALHREAARCRRERIPLGVLMADLDHFKRINDTFGHPVGDVVLCAAAKRLRSSSRVYDHVGRYGGEEFLVILPNCRLEESAGVAERMRQSVANGPVIAGTLAIPITLSVGVVAADDLGEIGTTALLNAADAAMYRAKRGGRNRVAIGSLADAILPAAAER